MMGVRVVGMFVQHRLMAVPVGMWSFRHGIVVMVVMLIMYMGVRVFDCHMDMLVVMHLGKKGDAFIFMLELHPALYLYPIVY